MLAVAESQMTRLLEVRDVLTFSFDFELLEEPIASEEYATPSPWVPAFRVPNASAQIVGRDATGGVYVSCLLPGPRQTYLHIDTQGHAALLGSDLEHALALLIALPYWHQLLLEAPSEDLEALRDLAAHLEREVCDDLPDLQAARAYLHDFLQLPALSDPVKYLHALSVEREAVTVLSPHGWRYTSPLSSAKSQRFASIPPA
ncbi:MAG: hypothetical protein QM756_42245 [Polyangiaceae bacterium]